MRKVADGLEADKKNKSKTKLILSLRKFIDICESAAALSQTGPMSMDMEALNIALDMVADGGHSLPMELQIQVTERACMEACVKVRNSDPDDADKAAEELLERIEVWSMYGAEAGLQDDWDYRNATYKALTAMLDESEDPDTQLVQAQKQAPD